MKNFTINSRKFNREITFSRPGSHYVYVDFNDGRPQAQICGGGVVAYGSTIMCSGDNEKEFEAVCRHWWKNFLRFDGDLEIQKTLDNLLYELDVAETHNDALWISQVQAEIEEHGNEMETYYRMYNEVEADNPF